MKILIKTARPNSGGAKTLLMLVLWCFFDSSVVVRDDGSAFSCARGGSTFARAFVHRVSAPSAGRELASRNAAPEELEFLQRAVDENHFQREDDDAVRTKADEDEELTHKHIDLSIPLSVYDRGGSGVDLVWDLMRSEAQREAAREPLLVSFLYSSVLNHASLESALAFHLANRLSSPAFMIATQIQSLVTEALENSPEFRRSVRADMMAVRDRDPACTCLPDVFLYFKGFHALQTHRVAHYLHSLSDRKRVTLAHFLQSQVSQTFQIDIHPNATLGAGLMLDHGTGIVIGETAVVGHNCSILHHVTLGGSGKRGVDRHPKIGSGVLLGAGASVLGNVRVGNGVQIGAGTLVTTDLPDHSVAVGVPAKIIGTFREGVSDPSIKMRQTIVSADGSGSGDKEDDYVDFVGSGI